MSPVATNANANDTSQVSKVPLYEGSTQYKNWRYSTEQLSHIRAGLNEAAVAVIRGTFEADQLGSSRNVSFLTADEEHLLVKLYITKIAQLSSFFKFPEEVEATAVTYLKRFYLKNTVMDWHPKNVMLTALFLATKTTNNPISLERYTTRIPKTAPADVLDLEFLVAQSLGFEFAVWHAHRALWGIWLDIQSIPGDSEKLPPAFYETALNHVRASRLTDAELIYTPSQIALAAFSLSLPVVAEQWVATKMPADFSDLSPVIDDIKHLITSQGHTPDVESVREVDRRLRICKNPEKVIGSKAFLARKLEDERLAEEKRSKKAAEMAEMQEGANNSDPFGNELSKTRQLLVDYDDDDDDD